ncbi:vitamin B12 ABC transporter ATP-binding protein BtuD [Vibrio sp. Y2-5]|uniref:vitamin B12 ABC transporter ATP-binding protein BtuD n=1 Tax=Vibrio sp. Y2-5 TaxID=2743977 RepID=UPI001660414D|nr:vitamin B12 ABC transporter ATP-binding protein BtuD [Vibrio sp. Y2-5]MBD0786811.1 vitamin B12 ABC transporter ATP-binding protein BtuD [Vibrio sp. Y2-5]
MIRVNSLHVKQRLLPLSFQCQAGEILHVVGPNGSGKSTLLSALAGVIDSAGEILLGDFDIKKNSLSELALRRAYLSQSEKPTFNLDVFQYLALSLPVTSSLHDSKVKEAVKFFTHVLKIDDKLHRSIHQLSGGEWQRVRLAGSCLQVWPAINPYSQLLILDEPGAPLDIAQEGMLYQLIEKMAQEGLAIVMANHDLNRSLRNADKVLLLKQGVVQSIGEPTEVLSEENLHNVFNTSVKCVSLDGKPYLIFD